MIIASTDSLRLLCSDSNLSYIITTYKCAYDAARIAAASWKLYRVLNSIQSGENITSEHKQEVEVNAERATAKEAHLYIRHYGSMTADDWHASEHNSTQKRYRCIVVHMKGIVRETRHPDFK
jgi:hypothetical protein